MSTKNSPEGSFADDGCGANSSHQIHTFRRSNSLNDKRFNGEIRAIPGTVTIHHVQLKASTKAPPQPVTGEKGTGWGAYVKNHY